jgi:hypothetical protein
MKRTVQTALLLSLISTPAWAQVEFEPSMTQDNSALVTQSGSDNTALINQRVSGLLNGQALASVEQNGDANDAIVHQSSVTSPVSGDFDNAATIRQLRDRGEAVIRQVHDYGSVVANTATIIQRSDDADAVLRQRGDDNTAIIRQKSAAFLPFARVEQNGVSNRAVVNQESEEGRVRVFQGRFSGEDGDSPETNYSRAVVNSLGVRPDIYVEQFGFDQRADILENAMDGRITVRMDGDFNTVDVTQLSTDGLVESVSTQGSFDNSAMILQEASDVGSRTFIAQEGWSGSVDIVQKDVGGLGGDNLADVTQAGMGSMSADIYATIIQDGGANFARVHQAANYAQSDVIQSGMDMTAIVNQ